MPPIICFIDDSQFELDVFSDCIIASAPDIEFITGLTYQDVRTRLGDRHPCLFLLDLYGREPGSAAAIPPRETLENNIETFGTLADVYEGLEEFQGDRTNEYLKRLFRITDDWRRLFYQVSREAGQSIAYGLQNLEYARRDYPAAAAIAYTRKSLIIDAVEILEHGIDGICLKPGGPSDDAIRQATADAAAGMLRSWYQTINRSFDNYLKDVILFMVRSGFGRDVSNLRKPGTLSAEVRGLLGPGDLGFLKTAEQWWDFYGQDPLI